jgi:hypothetical protein
MGLAQWQAAGNGGSGGAASAGGGKGKGQLGEGSYDSEFPAALPGSSAAGGSAVAAALSAARAAGSAKAPENKTARYLDVRDETYREALVSAANAAQVRGGDRGNSCLAAFAFICLLCLGCCLCSSPSQQLGCAPSTWAIAALCWF